MGMRSMQAARARNFMQPLRAAKSPFAGFLEVKTPIGKSKSGKPEELEIFVPVTKREEMSMAKMSKCEMMSFGAAVAAAAVPMVAEAGEFAKEEISESLKKKICAANPTAAACSSKPNKMSR